VLQAKVRVFIELFQMRQQAAIQAEEQARRIMAEAADRHKDEFLGMLAHELRNPLGPILNAVHLLRSDHAQNVPQDKLLDIVSRQVTHMSRLIDDLLDARRLARGQILLRKERCDLAYITYQTAEDHRTLFDSNGLHLDINVPKNPVWVDGDATRLAQVIGNLLHNAYKFTERGGKVAVRLECDEDDGTATITVTDTGIGITSEMLPRIFDVFCQADQSLDRSRGGLGLGLALVKGLVGLHNGSIVATSEGPGKGSAFVLHMPLELIPVSSHKRAFSTANSNENKHRILIIEDNQDAAETIHMLLALDGHDMQIAYNGRDGLKMARQFRPGIVLCDVGLPNMDGYQVIREMRKDGLLSCVYAIAITGYGRDTDRANAEEAGFDMHLTKPIDWNNLRQIIKLVTPKRLQKTANG
jgi:CheY-like chemotaxis protein/nitrogen-specific signal transduction histidine kinase